MKPINRRWVLSAIAMVVGCGAENGQSSADNVGEVSQAVQLGDAVYDGPMAPTLCTVRDPTNGEVMRTHCCPDWETGKWHSFMIGANVGQNVWRCARIPFTNVSSLPVELSKGVVRSKNGVQFLTCPGGMGMVGLSYDTDPLADRTLRRVVCARLSARPPLAESTDFNGLDPSIPMHVCSPFVAGSGPFNAGLMTGISTTLSQNVLLCAS